MDRNLDSGGAMTARRDPGDWERFVETFSRIADNVNRVIQGKEAEVRLAVACPAWRSTASLSVKD